MLIYFYYAIMVQGSLYFNSLSEKVLKESDNLENL